MIQTSMTPPFEVSVLSGQHAVRCALEQVLAALEPLQLDLEELSTVELVLAEALNNVVEHAYPENAPDGPIRIGCSHLADGLHVSINDHGRSIPDGIALLGARPELDVETNELPEGGFGWFLIKDLAKDVQYCSVGGENQLNLRIAVAYNGPSH